MKKYKLIVSGGTFDKFHKGHRDFLNYQLSLSEEVLLGITTDEFAKSKSFDRIDPYEVRGKAVTAFLDSIGAGNRVRIEQIDSKYIPGVWITEPIEAIIATEDTKRGAELINNKRRKYKQSILPIEIFSMTAAQDGKPIASRRIRNGEIDRDGMVYLSDQIRKTTYQLPDSLRDELKKPFGQLIINNDFDYPSLSMQDVMTVGDIATRTFLSQDLIPHIAVVDLIVERKKTFTKLHDIGFSGNEIMLSAENPSGTVTTSLSSAVHKAFTYHPVRKIVIMVSGEEDLAVIPILLRAPLDTCVFYGQPREGIVKVDVTEDRKKYARHLLEKFKK